MGYALDIKSVGETHATGGYVTTLRAILTGGSTPAELESRLGFTPGSFFAGYWLLGLAPMTRIEAGEFEFRGYTHLEGGVPAGQSQNVHESLMASYSDHPVDQQTRQRLVDDALRKLNADGLDRICKIYPINASQVDYEPGDGVVQYVVTAAKTFEVLARVDPGMHLRALAPGVVESTAA